METEAECNGATHLQCKWYLKCVSRKQMHSTCEPWQMYSVLKPGSSINNTNLTVSTQSPGATLSWGLTQFRRVLPKLRHKQASSTPIYVFSSIGLQTGESFWGRDMEGCPSAWSWWSGLQGGWLEDAASPGLLGWNGSSKLHASLSCGLWVMVSWEEGLPRGNKGADAIKQAINHMSTFMANVHTCRSIFQIAGAVGL